MCSFVEKRSLFIRCDQCQSIINTLTMDSYWLTPNVPCYVVTTIITIKHVLASLQIPTAYYIYAFCVLATIVCGLLLELSAHIYYFFLLSSNFFCCSIRIYIDNININITIYM